MNAWFGKVLLAATFLLALPAANAADFGKFLFNNDCQCTIAPPGTVMSQGDIDVVSGYFYVVVNHVTNDQAPNLGDTITICDGSECVPLKFLGKWISNGPTTADNGHGYRNAQANRTGGVDGNPWQQFTVWYTTGSLGASGWSLVTTQGSVTVTCQGAGCSGSNNSFVSSFGHNYQLGSGQSTFPFGADMAAGGSDLSGGGTGKSVCEDNSCTVMER